MGAKISVEIVGNADDLSKAFKKAQGDAQNFGAKMNSTIGKLGKAGAFGAAAVGVAGLTAAVKIGIDEWSESQRVMAQSEAVIKSTGGAANITAQQMSDLATSLMRKSGVDDEAIQSGENLLATFTKVRNEVGQGNDVFNQATAAALDMSVAMGKDMTSSATLVGKALNDPIAGLSSLRRVGVQFTDSQKEAIKAMVEAGDTMGAQKTILKELEVQFGGSAEAAGRTLPGQLAIARESFNNFAGEIVAKVVPSLERFGNWIRENWPQIRQAIQNAWQAIKPTFVAFGEIVDSLSDTFKKHEELIKDVLQRIQTAVKLAFSNLAATFKIIAALIRGDWGEAWDGIKTIASNTLKGIENALGLARDIYGRLAKAMGQAIIDGLLAMVNGIKSAALAIGNAIVDGISAGLSALAGALERLLKAPLNAVISAWNSLGVPGFGLHINIPGPVPDVDFSWPGISLPDIPHLAKGGIVTRPTLAMIGERGPEAVVPLGRMRQGVTVNVHVGQLLGGSAQEIARTLAPALVDAINNEQRVGRLRIAGT